MLSPMIHSVAFYDMQAHSPRILELAPRDRAVYWLYTNIDAAVTTICHFYFVIIPSNSLRRSALGQVSGVKFFITSQSQ